MHGDHSRLTFRREKHYSSVRMQQGRIWTDADFNEQVEIGRHRDQSMASDLLGGNGTPGQGFWIVPIDIANLPSGPVLLLSRLFRILDRERHPRRHVAWRNHTGAKRKRLPPAANQHAKKEGHDHDQANPSKYVQLAQAGPGLSPAARWQLQGGDSF